MKTLAAADGRQALDLAKKTLPTLILFDIMLPEVDGLEVARRLKANSATKKIPIIAVTAATSRSQAMAAGCDDHISKPIDMDMFLSKVEQHLRPSAPVGNC